MVMRAWKTTPPQAQVQVFQAPIRLSPAGTLIIRFGTPLTWMHPDREEVYEVHIVAILHNPSDQYFRRCFRLCRSGALGRTAVVERITLC
jgi:hypothetical protein